MKLLFLSVLATSAFSPNKSTTSVQASDWTFGGRADSECVLRSEGRATDSLGAIVNLSCAATDFGNAGAKIDALKLRNRRVTLTAEMHARDANNPALWIKVLREGKTLSLESTADQTWYEDAAQDDWMTRVVSIAVPAEASTVSFGVLLQGGEVQVRNLRLSVSGYAQPSAEAQHVLDEALRVVKQQTAYRRDIAWERLEEKVRLFAADAQRTAEVYPAINYLLAQLGDRRSMLLPPELAAMFGHRQNQQPDATAPPTADSLKLFLLPDGSKLVLSAYMPQYDGRTVKTSNGRPAATE